MSLETYHSLNSSYRKRSDKLQFQMLYALMFGIFLVMTCVSRLMPWHWSEAFAAHSPSIFDKTRSLTNNVVPFVFMG